MDRFTARGLYGPGAVRGRLGIREFRNPVGATLAVALIIQAPLAVALFAINEFGNQKYAIIRI